MMLVLVTGTSALVMEKSLIGKPGEFILVLIGLFLTGGSANALNQYFERDIDAKMSRTRQRRPLPLKKLSSNEALLFAITIGLVGVLIFMLCFNVYSALLSLGTILFYGFFYTLWLKPNTSQNIVIGGIAGAMAPVISWAAAADTLFAAEPWLLFLIIFLWTPPHFWALALYLKDDYKKVNLPMLPVVKGDDFTLTQMYYYTIGLIVISIGLGVYSASFVYLIIVSLLSWVYIKKSAAVRISKDKKMERELFRFSIIYLFTVFMTIIVEGMVKTVFA